MRVEGSQDVSLHDLCVHVRGPQLCSWLNFAMTTCLQCIPSWTNTACLPAGAMDVSLSPGTYFTLISGIHSSVVPSLRLDCEQDVDKSRAHGRFATACAITALINEQPLQRVADTWGAPGGIVRDGVGL